jgi:alanine racemase
MTNADKRTWAEINLDNLEHNYREIRRRLPEGCRFAGLCKANAYGHGVLPVARRLEQIGAEYLAVSCYDEAVQLRENGIRLPILMLAPSPGFMAKDIARLGAEQSLGDIDCAREMNEALSGTGLRLRVHIKWRPVWDNGLQRFRSKTFSEIKETLSLPNIDVVGFFTHFCRIDVPGEETLPKGSISCLPKRWNG